MTTLNYTFKFTQTALSAMICLCASQASFALEPLSDETLSSTTGEGIALVPQETYFVFQGENSTDKDLTNRALDTGYIHLVPVGPLTNAALDTNKDNIVDGKDYSVGKADLFIYGLALSKSDGNHNTRLAATDTAARIGSWGTATNPWILKVQTENQVPNFDAASSCAGATDPKCQVPYLTFEAPLFNTTTPTNAVDGADAYKLKMGLWADAFVLDPSKKEGDAALYKMGATSGVTTEGRANRLRLQAIWNDFTLNGSRLQVFQTLNGASNSRGMSAFYNNTLGLAGLVRLNSGDSTALRTTSPNGKVLRLSTQETTNTNLLDSPAVNGTLAPTFSANEGIFIHNLNANLVLGSLYQPLILGTDGTNFSLELTRIPNKPEIYNKIYTDYDNPNSSVYKGSTCNVYKCGSNGLTGYHGNNATHSSITMGTTIYDSTKNTLSAYKGADAMGVSFGAMNPIPQTPGGATPTPSFKNLGSAVIDGVLIQHMKITTKGL